jgi:hypothetical protein
MSGTAAHAAEGRSRRVDKKAKVPKKPKGAKAKDKGK